MTKIYFDSDFLISFLCLNDNNFHIVEKTYNNHEYIIPKEVLSELERRNTSIVMIRIRKLISDNKISIYEMDINDEASTLKYILQTKRVRAKKMDAGEAAASALCCCNNGILASNNMKDVSLYVELQDIKHITTSRVLVEAFNEGIIKMKQASAIWSKLIVYGRNMPRNSFQEFLESKEI